MSAKFENIEVPRDRWGRPMIMPASGHKTRIAYQRCTTFVGVLENTYNLMAWKQRQTVLGMGQRKDLVLAAAAADPNNKKLLDEIADKACEQAQSSAAATTGTALHSLTERIDRGQTIGHVPAEYATDLKAYEAATAEIEFTDIEAFRVHDDFRVAGTADRIGYYHGRLTIMDIKSGSIDYPSKMAMQLAMYARSLPYNIATDKRGTDPKPMNLNTGIIIHLPAGQGVCDLYEIDIEKGWGACLIAKKVWSWRGVKGLTHQVGQPRENTWEKSNSDKPTTPTWESLITAAISVDDLRVIWKRASELGELTDELRALCTERSDTLRKQ